MITEVLQAKHDKVFDLLDRNGNGELSRTDFELLADDLIATGADNPHTPAADAVRRAYLRAFERFAEHTDTNRDGVITRQEFHAAMATPADRAARFDDIWGPTCDVEFDHVDTNSDGKLDRDEFTALMAGFSHTPTSASAAFDKLATDGFITRTAYYDAWRSYVASDDENHPAGRMMP
ncbi:EF-hand domain-containing protein [Streptomyces lavendulae]|uniref:EF-hand domain-containing protein n=1 Tax=Streptomyces lavendulae TaxID=1914 RepID=UPI0033FA15B6